MEGVIDRSKEANILPAMLKPTNYEVLAERLEEANRKLSGEIAARLLSALKAEMRSGRRPHETYEGKMELVRWVNAELRRFNLAFRHPRTGRRATLRVQRGYRPETGYFELLGKDEGGGHRTWTTPDLEALLAKLVLIRRS
jgi:hypothetical protein